MTSYVFDTGVISLFFLGDERLRTLVDRIQQKGDSAFLSSVTVAEFYYKTCRNLGQDVAALRSKQLSERMQVVDASLEISFSAGLEKCRNGRLSLADCYALKLTKQLRGLLLTTDSELAKTRDAKVRFFEVWAEPGSCWSTLTPSPRRSLRPPPPRPRPATPSLSFFILPGRSREPDASGRAAELGRVREHGPLSVLPERGAWGCIPASPPNASSLDRERGSCRNADSFLRVPESASMTPVGHPTWGEAA
jgi:predicted nucleic acid-binding protein